jgi:hypothetical protein
MRLLIAALIILSLASPLVLAEDQESARQVLETRGIQFTEDEFVERARRGDISAIELMLDAGMTPDAEDRYGTPALIAGLFESKGETRIAWPGGIAIFYGRSLGEAELFKESLEVDEVEVIKAPHFLAIAMTLLDRGANPNATDKKGTTAIIYLAQEGNEVITKALLVKGADVNAKNAEGESALLLATENGHTAVAAMLIENDADVNVRNPDGLSILEMAIDGGRTEIVKLLLKEGAELHPEVLAEHAEKPGVLHPKSLGHGDRMKILEAAAAILKAENVDKQNKINLLQNQLRKLQGDVVDLKRKTSPHLELLYGS